MKIWNVPIESLEERYSKDWNIWFPEVFEEENIEYETVYGDELTNKIEQGSFLDVIGTNYFKSSQIQKICKLLYEGKIKDNDVIFFHDLWFPGLESLAYIRNALGLKFKITGMLHAGTWDVYDFLTKKGMTPWARNLENCWFQFVDAIFVATNFHKELILEKRDVKCSIYVTGLPVYPPPYLSNGKEKIIVFPHRLDSEKQPEEFDRLEKLFREEYPELSDWKFIKSKDVTKSKIEYYELLRRSTFAVSTALQETWGIAMQEALFYGCIPCVPNRLSYSEMYLSYFKYNSIEELGHDLGITINNQKEFLYAQDLVQVNGLELLQKGVHAIYNMIEKMENLT